VLQKRRKYGPFTKAEFDEFYKGYQTKPKLGNIVNVYENLPFDKQLEVNCNAFEICK